MSNLLSLIMPKHKNYILSYIFFLSAFLMLVNSAFCLILNNQEPLIWISLAPEWEMFLLENISFIKTILVFFKWNINSFNVLLVFLVLLILLLVLLGCQRMVIFLTLIFFFTQDYCLYNLAQGSAVLFNLDYLISVHKFIPWSEKEIIVWNIFQTVNGVSFIDLMPKFPEFLDYIKPIIDPIQDKALLESTIKTHVKGWFMVEQYSYIWFFDYLPNRVVNRFTRFCQIHPNWIVVGMITVGLLTSGLLNPFFVGSSLKIFSAGLLINNNFMVGVAMGSTKALAFKPILVSGLLYKSGIFCTYTTLHYGLPFITLYGFVIT